MPVPGDNYALWNQQFNDAMKKVYAKGGVQNLWAVDTPILKTIGGLSQNPEIKQEGDGFIFPLSHNFSQGHSYHARGSGPVGFRQARPGKVKKATVTATQHLHRISTDWESVARAGQSQVPEAAFERMSERLLNEAKWGCLARVEESIMYDGTNLGIFQGGTGAATISNETVDGVVKSILHVNITYESFALGLFLGKEGAAYDIYALTSKGRPTGTRLNNNASVTLGDGNTAPQPVILEAIGDAETRQLWFSGNATDLTAIANAINTNPVTTNYGLVYWDTVGNITNGMDWIITNGTSSSYYGIDPNLSLFYRGATADNGSKQMTYQRFQRMILKLVQKGLSGAGVKELVGQGAEAERLSMIDVWCNPTTYSDITSNEGGNVRHETPTVGAKATVGFSGVVINTMLGPTRFWAYNKIKQGEMMVMPTALVSDLVGTQVPTLRNWGKTDDQQYFRQVEGVTGLEAAMYGILGYFISRPGYCLKISGIRNSDYTG